MKKVQKIVAMLLCAATLCALLCACGGKVKDVPVAELSDAVVTALGKKDSMLAMDEIYTQISLKTSADQFDGWSVMVNAYGANIDEYGIFKASDTLDVKAVEQLVREYLATREASWMDAYMPLEKPKLLAAEVQVLGDYVMYCILDDADKATAFKTFEDTLK